jgi:hypothetical protein
MSSFWWRSIYVVACVFATTQRVTKRRRSSGRSRATQHRVDKVHRLLLIVTAFSVVAFSAAGCGGRISAEKDCSGSDCASRNEGEAGVAPWGDAAGTLCAVSCGALKEVECAANYDAARCFSGCEQARAGPCGAPFALAVQCYVDYAVVSCSPSGGAGFEDRDGQCSALLQDYAHCAALAG